MYVCKNACCKVMLMYRDLKTCTELCVTKCVHISLYHVFWNGKGISTNNPFPQTNLFPVTGGKKFMKFKSHLTSATLYFT